MGILIRHLYPHCVCGGIPRSVSWELLLTKNTKAGDFFSC